MTTPERYKSQILSTLFDHFNPDELTVILFGSMARGEARKNSDIDLGLDGATINDRDIARAKESFELSNIPYKIDLVNLKTASESFKEIALSGSILWHQGRLIKKT